MNEIDCLQVEILKLKQRIKFLENMVQLKLEKLEKEKDITFLNSELEERNREKDSVKNKKYINNHNHYVNILTFG